MAPGRFKKPETPRRSPCPVACGLDLFGDRWTLLVIRDLTFGAKRFKDFSASPEGIPTNILSDRLNRLRESGVIELVPASDGSRHSAYRLTEMGRELRPVLAAMRDRSLKWEDGSRVEESRAGSTQVFRSAMLPIKTNTSTRFKSYGKVSQAYPSWR